MILVYCRPMDVVIGLLRVLHIGLGVFWAGAIFFIVLFLEPSVRGAGPAGGAVMAGLQRRRLMLVLPLVALLTIASGFALYWLLWGAALGTTAGMTLGTGGVASVVAFLVGWFAMRPAQLEAGRLGAALAGMPEGPERAETASRLDALGGRIRTAGRSIAALLAVAVLAMALARYL